MKKILSILSAFSLITAASSSVVSCDSSNKEEDQKVYDLLDMDFSSLKLTAGDSWFTVESSIKSIIYDNTSLLLQYGKDWKIDNYKTLVNEYDDIKANIGFQVEIINPNINVKGNSQLLKASYHKFDSQAKRYDFDCGFDLNHYRDQAIYAIQKDDKSLSRSTFYFTFKNDLNVEIDKQSFYEGVVVKNSEIKVSLKKAPQYMEGEIKQTFYTKALNLSTDNLWFPHKTPESHIFYTQNDLKNYVSDFVYRYYSGAVKIDVDYQLIFNYKPNEKYPTFVKLNNVTVKAIEGSKFLVGEYTIDYKNDYFRLS
ncbi:hypothetical protein SHELI_v1c04140 [Spiroplasma helicoides]|uniref:Lipoprotein n=1 Tax=Spiroplasma helicoides TaxID=216938 RepID=A0A1B3SKB5_9MOLU|nr:lipoprotein [Spiroplasma helicoides]AOG60365.1 hypothetical protein SHELI_v1c04140 [Spiroplasma helicoides]